MSRRNKKAQSKTNSATLHSDENGENVPTITVEEIAPPTGALPSPELPTQKVGFDGISPWAEETQEYDDGKRDTCASPGFAKAGFLSYGRRQWGVMHLQGNHVLLAETMVPGIDLLKAIQEAKEQLRSSSNLNACVFPEGVKITVI